jgi:hypothetical protein
MPTVYQVIAGSYLMLEFLLDKRETALISPSKCDVNHQERAMDLPSKIDSANSISSHFWIAGIQKRSSFDFTFKM